MRRIFLWAIVLLALLAAPGPDTAFSQTRLAKIVSLNVCTDQVLVALADPDQIAGLSSYGRSATLSFMADKAARYRALSGGAEDVLQLQPDLVLAGTFTSRATRTLLSALGYRVETFPPIRSVQDGKEQIAAIAAMIGQVERGAALIARIEAAEQRARTVNAGGVNAIYFQRRGFITGAESLMSDLFEKVGLNNAAGTFDRMRTGRVRLESLIAAPPAILVLSSTSAGAVDQGTALMHHPALLAAMPPDRRIAVPERFTVCGGPSLAAALDLLHDAIGARTGQ